MSEREASPESVDGRIVYVAAVLIAVAFLIGIAAGNGTTTAWWEKTTVSKGFAEYAIDESGSPIWRWKGDTHDQ